MLGLLSQYQLFHPSEVLQILGKSEGHVTKRKDKTPSKSSVYSSFHDETITYFPPYRTESTEAITNKRGEDGNGKAKTPNKNILYRVKTRAKQRLRKHSNTRPFTSSLDGVVESEDVIEEEVQQ